MRASIRMALAVAGVLCSLAAEVKAASAAPAGLSFAEYYEPYVSQIEPNAPGYTLPLDGNDLSNGAQVCAALGLAGVPDLIGKNGFAVLDYDFGWEDPNRDSMTKPYDYLKTRNVPRYTVSGPWWPTCRRDTLSRCRSSSAACGR